ncbi:MAG: RHS repeat-associated core domain-containing protein [Armatimonadota bacterium]
MPSTKAVNTWGLGLISTNREGTKRYFHFDAVGSTRALTDSSETVTDTYEYNAFGVVESSSGTSVNPFRYVGQYGYYDDGAMGSSSGLLLLGVRYYSPAHGRFWSWDPVPSLNLYGYVGNNATMGIDPSGEQEQNPRRVAGGHQARRTYLRNQGRFGTRLTGAVALISCILDAWQTGNDTPDDLLRVCITCCQGLGATLGATIGNIVAPGVGAGVGAGLGAIAGVLFCDDLCCWLLREKLRFAIGCGGKGGWPERPDPAVAPIAPEPRIG